MSSGPRSGMTDPALREAHKLYIEPVIQKGDSMKRMQLLVRGVLALSVTLVVFGGRIVSAQEPLKSGKILQRTELTNAKGMEAILVLRELPAGGESGKHTQSGK